MPAVNEDPGEYRQPDPVVQRQQQQAGEGRTLRSVAQFAPDPAAQPSGHQSLSAQRDERSQDRPEEIDQGAERRTLAIERTPFAFERAGGVRQHFKIVLGLGFELHDEAFQPACRAHAHLGICWRGRADRRYGSRPGGGPTGGTSAARAVIPASPNHTSSTNTGNSRQRQGASPTPMVLAPSRMATASPPQSAEFRPVTGYRRALFSGFKEFR